MFLVDWFYNVLASLGTCSARLQYSSRGRPTNGSLAYARLPTTVALGLRAAAP